MRPIPVSYTHLPVSSETNLLEESEPAEDEPKAEMVAEVEGKQYETLEAAIEAAQDKDTLTLLSNVSLRDHIIIRDKQITIDTAGYDVVYTAAVSYTHLDVYKRQLLRSARWVWR